MSESQLQLDEKNDIRMIWRGKNAAANNASMKSLVYIVPYENRMIRLTFLTLESLFDDGVPIFEKIASSYQTASTQTKLPVRPSRLSVNKSSRLPIEARWSEHL